MFNNFEAFIEKFSATFKDSDKEHMFKIKIRSLYQISPLVVIYASKFKQLACNISWGEVAFINQFQFGLQNDVKDLLFTLLDPST